MPRQRDSPTYLKVDFGQVSDEQVEQVGVVHLLRQTGQLVLRLGLLVRRAEQHRLHMAQVLTDVLQGLIGTAINTPITADNTLPTGNDQHIFYGFLQRIVTHDWPMFIKQGLAVAGCCRSRETSDWINQHNRGRGRQAGHPNPTSDRPHRDRSMFKMMARSENKVTHWNRVEKNWMGNIEKSIWILSFEHLALNFKIFP